MNLPKKNNYAVVFISKLKPNLKGYSEMNELAYQEALKMKGFIKENSARNSNLEGVSVSFWESLEDIEVWKHNLIHKIAKEKGKSEFYEYFEVYISKIEYGNSGNYTNS